jgi:tetratricopeptide (TPR) repeat protein
VQINEDKFVGGQTILDRQIDLKAGISYLIANGYGLDEEAFTLLKKSFCLLLAEEYPEALTSINQAEQKQRSATVYFIKALILERNRYHPNAFEYYDKALALDNDIYDAHRKKCVYYFEVHDWKNAHVELREMFRLQPASPVGHRLRGMIRFAQGYYGPAIGDFSEFIKADSTDDEIILMRSVSYMSVGLLKESLKDRLLLAKRNPKKWEFHEVLVENYLLLKDTTGALEILQTFRVNNPEESYAPYLKIIEIYINQERWADAQAELIKSEKMLNLSYLISEQSLILFWKGMVAFHHRKDPQEAIAQFDKSIKLNSGNPEVKYQRAQVYESMGQRKRAVSDYEELMNLGFKDSKERYDALTTKK